MPHIQFDDTPVKGSFISRTTAAMIESTKTHPAHQESVFYGLELLRQPSNIYPKPQIKLRQEFNQLAMQAGELRIKELGMLEEIQLVKDSRLELESRMLEITKFLPPTQNIKSHLSAPRSKPQDSTKRNLRKVVKEIKNLDDNKRIMIEKMLGL